ncbi:MAG: hypothetical protein PHE16_01415 [Aliarcobacter sp.]|nr:hypothetical protein [Aliarcobacter sp.]
MKLDENQLKEFHKNGFLILKNFADSQTYDEILQKWMTHTRSNFKEVILEK